MTNIWRCFHFLYVTIRISLLYKYYDYYQLHFTNTEDTKSQRLSDFPPIVC